MISQKKYKRRALLPAFSFTTLVFGGHVAAQTDAPLLEEMTITASRMEMPLRQVGASVSVMTAEELEQKSFPLLAEALRTLPSVDVDQSGGLGKQTSVRIRGEEAHRTLLLIDGINVSDVSTAQVSPNFAHILNSQIGRVEVLRGPQGMMYGADAGGVVSMFSKRSEQPFEGDVAAEVGRYDTRRVNGNVRGTLDRVAYSFSAADLSSDGFNAYVDDPTQDDDGYENTTLHGLVDVAVTDNLGVEVVARNTDSSSQFDRCGWPATYDCISDYTQNSGKVNLQYDSDKQGHELSYAVSTTDRMNVVGATGNISLDSEGELEQWQYVGHYELADDVSVLFGADHRSDSYTDNSSQETFERDQKGIFAEGQVGFNDTFFYTIGVRHDDNDDFGEHTSYRTTAAYLIPVDTGELKLKASYGTGFRAPSLFEVQYNNREGAPAYIPSTLTEEQSEGYELGVEWIFSPSTQVELVWFDNRIEDEIYFDMIAYGGYLQSSGETRSSGVEFAASAEVVDNLVLAGNYTYNDTELSGDTGLAGAAPGDPRRRRPKHLYNLSVRYGFWQDKVNLAAFYRSSSDAVDYDFGDGQVPLEDYQVLDLTGTWEVNESLEAYLRWENALDEEYQQVAGYNTSGSAAYAGLRVRF